MLHNNSVQADRPDGRRPELKLEAVGRAEVDFNAPQTQQWGRLANGNGYCRVPSTPGLLRQSHYLMRLLVSPVFNVCRIGTIEGQTLRYPAGRPIHRLFVIVFPSGVIAGGVSSL